MREFINVVETILLTETSRGLGARKPGDEFIRGNEKIYFSQIDFYPESGGKYQSLDQLKQAYDTLTAQLPIAPVQVNKPTARAGGFGIAQFKDEDDKILIYARFFDKIDPVKEKNKWANEVEGFKLNSGMGRKEQAGFKPTEVLTQLDNLTPHAILHQIAEKFTEHSYQYKFVAAIMQGQIPKIDIPKDDLPAFRDYFCEIVHPIALMTGVATGAVAKAERDLLAGEKFSDCTISFSSGKTQGLYDSLLTSPSGRVVKLSSKGGAGAKASVNNLYTALHELEGTEYSTLVDKFPLAKSIIDIIFTNGQIEGPLTLGVALEVITPAQREVIWDLKNKDTSYIEFAQQLAANPKILDSDLTKLWNRRVPKKPEQSKAWLHLLAGVAFIVAEHVNKKTDFPQAAAAILNGSGVVQVHTYTTGTYITSFDTVFPSETIKGVFLLADKVYYSTNINGKFTFSIETDNGKPPVNVERDDAVVSTVSSDEITSKIDDVASRTPMQGLRPTRAKRTISVPTDIETTRQKR